MKVNGIQNITYRADNSQNMSKVNNKPEFIDRFSNAVRNPRDVNDCVAVPRGIFKAYLFIMGGFAALGISGALPQKMKNTKMALNIAGKCFKLYKCNLFCETICG
jgi:hypothetical protein